MIINNSKKENIFKEIMAENNLTEASGGGYIAKYSESVSNNFNDLSCF